MTKQEVIRAAKLAPRLIPKIKPELKAAYRDFKKLGNAIIKSKDEPKKVKPVARKFKKVLDVHHKRLARAIEKAEPSLPKKLSLAISAVFLAFLLEVVVLLVTHRITHNERLTTIATVVFAAPIIEEFFRTYLEDKYNAGLAFSIAISAVELSRQIPAAITDFDPKLFSRFDIKTRQFKIDPKLEKFLKSTRWKTVLLTVLGKGMHFLNHFIQRFLLKKAKEEDRPKVKLVAYVISLIIHALWNVFGLSYLQKSRQKLVQLVKSIEAS